MYAHQSATASLIALRYQFQLKMTIKVRHVQCSLSSHPHLNVCLSSMEIPFRRAIHYFMIKYKQRNSHQREKKILVVTFIAQCFLFFSKSS